VEEVKKVALLGIMACILISVAILCVHDGYLIESKNLASGDSRYSSSDLFRVLSYGDSFATQEPVLWGLFVLFYTFAPIYGIISLIMGYFYYKSMTQNYISSIFLIICGLLYAFIVIMSRVSLDVHMATGETGYMYSFLSYGLQFYLVIVCSIGLLLSGFWSLLLLRKQNT